MKNLKVTFTLLILFLVSSVFSQNKDQLKEKEQINQEILKMDSLLFDVAFNTCDLELYKKITKSDFKFYADRSDLNKSIEKGIHIFVDRCSRPKGLTRRLVSSDAYVLGDYGAVQIGEHDFYIDDIKVQTAKFVTNWERRDDSWIITRAISYGHKDTLEEG
ncbi:MAG: hypothetical protein ACI8XB_000158 [Patiriisocius sp.]|jgi:hypothetical protein